MLKVWYYYYYYYYYYHHYYFLYGASDHFGVISSLRPGFRDGWVFTM